MTSKALFRHCVGRRVFKGNLAFMWALLAVLVPTAIRLSVDGQVSGVAVTPYLPFIVLSAVTLAWWQAGLVALASALIGDALFIGVPNRILEGPSDLFAVGAFLVAAGLIIAVVQVVREMMADGHRGGINGEVTNGIIFSLRDGEAWASWKTDPWAVRLGPQEEVAAMMEDFLAQIKVAERLNGDPGLMI